MDPRQEILELACEADGSARWRDRTLSAVRSAFDADVGAFVTKLPGEGMVATLHGFSVPEARAALERRWDAVGEEIAPVRREAERAGAATDLRTLGRDLYRRSVYRQVMAPHGGTESLFVVPSFSGRPLGFLMVGRCGGRFSDAALALARTLGPSLAVSCVAVTAKLPDPPLASLSPTEHELLRYLELGYTTREIATARGTSSFTVRNQLSTLYRKLDVSNRTEAVGLGRRTG